MQSGSPGHQAYVRFNAFHPDPRIRPDGSFVPGTFATTLRDSRVVPSGLAAVGRYALPNPFPANRQYYIVPIAGTQTISGAVIPNFGQAGGGVEILFPRGAFPDIGAPNRIADA